MNGLWLQSGAFAFASVPPAWRGWLFSDWHAWACALALLAAALAWFLGDYFLDSK